MVKTMLNLRKAFPYYGAFYETLRKVKSDSIRTMGVDGTRLVWSPDFVDKLDVSEVTFEVLHEVAHIALLHCSRKGDRDHTLWNVACDAYVNSMVVSDIFGFEISGQNKEGLAGTQRNVRGVVVKIPENLVFSGSISLEEDTVEGIYDSLYKQAKENGYFTNKGKFKFALTGSQSGCVNGEVEVNNTDCDSDLIDSGSNSEKASQEARRLVNEANTRYKLVSDGTGSGTLERIIGELLIPKINWKKLLRRYCRQVTSKESSFKHPDTRMCYQRAIYPGVDYVADPDSLSGMKICIDCSGSIGQEDLNYFLGCILGMLRTFNMKAELVWWDHKIQRVEVISSQKEVLKLSWPGGGGTDPGVIFEYFDSDKCKVKPEIIVVLSDMWFKASGLDVLSWKRKYKNTLWIHASNNWYKNINLPFGKLADLK